MSTTSSTTNNALPENPGNTHNKDTIPTVDTAPYYDVNEPTVFKPRRVLILTKLTRLDYERRTNSSCDEAGLEKLLRDRGSDYTHLVDRHNYHHAYLKTIERELERHGIEHRTVYRFDYNEAAVDWADAVFTAGGDGTFLLGASKIRTPDKPVVGINTDPVGSEGYMCLMKKLPESYFAAGLQRLLAGEFQWLWRQRIRIWMQGANAWEDPVELHDQQLLYPEHRWLDHIREAEEGVQQQYSINEQWLRRHGSWRGFDVRVRLRAHHTLYMQAPGGSTDSSGSAAPLATRNSRRMLPVLALNEVFMGESVSSRVSYFEASIDGDRQVKMKNSGMTVCTGTGSTSWYFNINRITPQCMRDILTITNEIADTSVNVNDTRLVNDICSRFNSRLIFDPDQLSEPLPSPTVSHKSIHTEMAYTIRDPIVNATFQCDAPRGFANQLQLRSRCFDAHLVIDGGMSFAFNTGTTAELEMHPQDALRTVVFR